MPPELIASQEVCKRFDINRSTLTRWVAAGRITPAMRLPGETGAFLFAPVEVDRLAAELEKAAS